VFGKKNKRDKDNILVNINNKRVETEVFYILHYNNNDYYYYYYSLSILNKQKIRFTYF